MIGDIMTTNDERLQKAMDELDLTPFMLDEAMDMFSAAANNARGYIASFVSATSSFAKMHADAAGDGDKLDDLIIARMEGNLALENLGLDLEHESKIKRMADRVSGK